MYNLLSVQYRVTNLYMGWDWKTSLYNSRNSRGKGYNFGLRFNRPVFHQNLFEKNVWPMSSLIWIHLKKSKSRKQEKIKKSYFNVVSVWSLTLPCALVYVLMFG